MKPSLPTLPISIVWSSSFVASDEAILTFISEMRSNVPPRFAVDSLFEKQSNLAWTNTNGNPSRSTGGNVVLCAMLLPAGAFLNSSLLLERVVA